MGRSTVERAQGVNENELWKLKNPLIDEISGFTYLG
ncbi:MAG: hypothetical protein FD121_1605 [Gallionellaceae bacterium]|nr:MAG: hypothetical protein FD121_1605 [Gallionellaceae bacterium]